MSYTSTNNSFLEKLFKLKENNTTVRKETTAGLATFFAMSYILFVNPSILSDTGMPIEAVFMATALSAAIATALMGIISNLPIALAPGMGLNAFFAYGVVLGSGYSWEMALSGVFISSIIFLILSISGIREKIINAIPVALKKGVAIAIGFFIAFIGLKNAGIIVDNPATLVGVGDLSNISTFVAILGLFITASLIVFKVQSAILIGMAITAIIALIFGITSLSSISSFNIPSLAPIFWVAIDTFPEAITSVEFYSVIFTYLFIDFFDTAGTLLTVSSKIGATDEKGNIKIGKGMLVDASSTMIGSVLGTSSVTSYIESLVGVENGGKTGLVSLVVATLFLISILLSPFLGIIHPSVTAPALIIVGAFMIQAFKEIDLNDNVTSISVFLMVMITVFGFSIAKGIAVGFLAHTLFSILLLRYKEISMLTLVLSILFILGFIFKLI